MRLACASAKGGSGKTTVSALLTLSLAAAGKTVRVSDHDPQLAFLGWMETMAEKKLIQFRKESGRAGIVGEGDPAHEIGDFAPEDPDTLAGKVSGWDLVLVPTRPSPLDVKAAAAFFSALADPSRAKLLWNCLDSSGLSSPEALAAMLKPHPKITPMKTALKNRAAFRYMQRSGVDALTRETRDELIFLGMEVFA